MMSLNYLTIKEIDQETENISKPTAYSNSNYPLNFLTDRNFEILLYYIFRERINRKDPQIEKLFDYVDLMQGVGEKGRDCILTKNGRHVGVIQCKKINSNISSSAFIKEIIKFIMYSVIEQSLIDDIDNFVYFFAVSTGLSGTTKELIRDFNTNLFNDFDLEEYFNQIKNEYKSVSNLVYDDVKDEINLKLKRIKVERILPQDIEYWLSDMLQIQRMFFDVKTVTDNSLISTIEKTYLIPILNIIKKDAVEVADEFQFNLKEYLQRSYLYYSSARTLVFGNQQKRLEDFYYPLELAIKHNKKSTIIETKQYPNDLLPIYKKVILVDSGGMGKSTIMKWLFTCAIKENKGIPIFVELRLLSQKHTLLDEIINSISPIDKAVNKNLFLTLVKQGQFIFFFDGYDEIKTHEKEAVTKDLNNFITKVPDCQFIITSRPENEEGRFGDFQTFHINPLTTDDAYKLIEKLGDYNQRSKALINKLQETDFKNVKEFLKNPLLISLLYKKFEYRESIPLHKQEFYYEVFEALYKAHDLTKGSDYYIREKKSNLTFTNFFKVLRAIGFKSVQNNDLEYNKSILIKLLDSLKEELPNVVYDSEALLDDLVLAVPLFQKEGLTYKWAHKSIQEYFAAEFICMDTKNEQENILLAIFNGKRLGNLLHVLNLCYDIDYRSFRNSILYKISSDYVKYCNNTFVDVVKNGIIPINLIRDRQYQTYTGDNYLLRTEKHVRSLRDVKAVFTKIISKLKVMNRVSADGYYVGTVRKNQNVRMMVLMLAEKRNKLIKQPTKKDMMYLEERDGPINKSNINLFDGTIIDKKIFVDDNPENPVNCHLYFSKVSTFLRSTFFDYEECVKLIIEVDKEREKLKAGDTLTSGF